ncbi:MAG: asparagine--tRNA ligase, partial [Planctomycetes bacterium]|nr:asparagine--tRNA ligase [Planctomycetota bacterium]
MQDVYVNRLARHVGQEVRVRGWLYNKRSKGRIHFLQVRDGTGTVQGVVGSSDVDPTTFERCGQLTQESSVMVTGVVRSDERAPGGHELSPVTGLEVVQLAQDYPIALQSHGPDFLLSHRHLWLRSRRQHAQMRVRDEVLKAIRDFYYERDFVCVDAPIFTPAACEGTTTLFEVSYFDEKAYLTQSGQLY